MARQHRRRPRRRARASRPASRTSRRADEAELRRPAEPRRSSCCLMGLEMPSTLSCLRCSRRARNHESTRDAPGYIDYSTVHHAARGADRASTARSATSTRWEPARQPRSRSGQKELARAIEDRLRDELPGARRLFKQNLDAYLAKLDAAIAALEGGSRAAARGKKLRELPPRHGLLRRPVRHGAGSGRSRSAPGIDPTPRPSSPSSERSMRREHGRSSWFASCTIRPGSAETVAEPTGAKLVELPAVRPRRARGAGLHQPSSATTSRTLLKAVHGRLGEPFRRSLRLRDVGLGYGEPAGPRARQPDGSSSGEFCRPLLGTERRRQDDACSAGSLGLHPVLGGRNARGTASTARTRPLGTT